MMNRTLLAMAAVLALGAGCSDDDSGNNNNTPMPEFTAVTYNGGLARGFVDFADDRAQHVADAVGALDANLICVQEIWLPEHVTMVENAAAANFPNQLFLEDMPDTDPGEPACDDTATEYIAFEGCARTECGTVAPSELVDCVLLNCGFEFSQIDATCNQCVAANVGGTIDEMVNICTQSSAAYAYNGAFGIGILTNETITSSDSSVFASTFNRRAVLHAELDTEALGTVHVYCTHLTAIFSTIPWPKPTGSWEQEQMAQITEMRDYIDETSGEGDTVILLGDFNTGPGGGTDWVAEYDDNYNALSDGLTNPFLDSDNATCTFCDANPLNGGIDHGDSVLIDHILYQNFTGTTDASRVLTGPLNITVDGTPIETTYSDHYGVMVTFMPESPAQM